MRIFLLFLVGLFFINCNDTVECTNDSGYIYDFDSFRGSPEFSTEYQVEVVSSVDFMKIVQCHPNGFCLNYHFKLGENSVLYGYKSPQNLRYLRKKQLILDRKAYTIYKYLDEGMEKGIEDESFLYVLDNIGIVYQGNRQLNSICSRKGNFPINEILEAIKQDKSFCCQDMLYDNELDMTYLLDTSCLKITKNETDK